MATRTALSPSWTDVDHAINGGGTFTGPATHGTIINIPGGPATWPTPMQTTQKLQIVGLDPLNPPVITGGAGGPIFKLRPVLNDARLRLSNMVWVRNTNGDNDLILSLDGLCPINNDLTGGFQIDKIYVRADNVLNTGGHKVNENGKNWSIGGWMEGVVFDCVFDFDVTKGTLGTGEHIIMNQNRSPSSMTTAGYGDYSWSHAYSLGTIHQVVFEDCIIKRRGGMDCNQWGGGDAGGARYTGRHCTSWGSIGSGHEARSDGANRMSGGLRASESYKNLFIRDGTDTTGSVQSSNLTNIRSGENVTWGNRYNRYGGHADGAGSPLSLDAYNYSAWNKDHSFGGPDGANPWDLNETGVITPNGSSFTPTSTDSFGSIYASGTGGSRASDVAPGFLTVTLTGMSSMVTDRWKGFVIRNLDAVNGRASPTPCSFAFIDGNGAGTFTVAPSSQPSGTKPVDKQFKIAAGNRWEIRRVKQYFNTVGSGTMDAMPDFNFSGSFEDANYARLETTGLRRWTNNTTPGVSQWDNKYRLSAIDTFHDIANWQGTTKYGHAIINARNTASHPGYSYSSGTSGGPDNLVGAASSVWDFLTNVIGDPNNIAAIPGVDSLSQTGSGGGLDYPHPFRASAATPNITSQDHASFTQGVGGTFQATSSGFSAGPTWARSGGTFPASGTSLNTSTGLLTVGVGSAAGTYNFDLVATNGGQSDTQPFTLTITASPTKVILLTGPLAFGDHDALTTSTLPLTIKNTGNTVLTVTSISLPSGYTADWTSGTIAPAASQTVTVTFSPLAATSYNGTVTVSSDKTSGTNTISITGVGVTRVLGLSGDLAFGDVTVGQTSTRQMTIANTGNRALTISSITYPPDFSGSFTGSIAAGGTHLVDVTFSPTLEQAYTGIHVTVGSDKTSGTNTLAVSGTGVVTATKIIQLSGDLNFGEVQTGTTVTKTLTITNGGDTNLAVASISYPTGFTGSYAGTIAPGASHDVTVTFAPLAATSYGGDVTVTSDATGGIDTTTASGDGVVPSTKIIGLTTGAGASSFTFGNVQVGGTATRTLVIANTGSATLTVTSITLPTGYSGSFAGTIASGATHNVTITFSPVSNIVYSGTITVNSDKTSGTNTIGTTGTGVQAGTKVIGLTGDLNFGNVQKLHTVVRPFTIMNSGTLALVVSAITCPTGFTADISSVTLVPGASQVVNVTFAPLAQQTYSGDITVTSDKTAGINTIPCSGNGKNKKQVPMFVIVN